MKKKKEEKKKKRRKEKIKKEKKREKRKEKKEKKKFECKILPVYMEASRAATGILEVLATSVVRFMIDSVTPPISTVSCRKKNTQTECKCN